MYEQNRARETDELRILRYDYGRALKQMQGYSAAFVIIRDLMTDAQEKTLRKKGREHLSVEWWKGHHQGLLAAYCYGTLGNYPDHPDNAAQIKRVMEDNK